MEILEYISKWLIFKLHKLGIPNERIIELSGSHVDNNELILIYIFYLLELPRPSIDINYQTYTLRINEHSK